MRKYSNKFFWLLSIIIIGVIFGLGVGLVKAWVEPGGSPPNGNLPAPINVGNLGQVKAGGLMLNTAGAPYGLIVASGNVGVGVLNPSQKLDVAGALRLQPSSAPTGVGLNGVIYYDSTENKFKCYQNGSWVDCIGGVGGGGYWAANGNSIYNTNSGNVGIGTTTPTTKLMVVSSDGDELRFSDGFFSGRDGLVITGNAGATGVNIQNKSATGIAGIQIIDHTGTGKAHMGWWNSDQRLEIASDKNIVLLSNDPNFGVGIGTNSPTQKLDVNGYVKGTGFCIGDDCRTSWPSGGGGGYWAANGNNIYNTNSGNVGIGTTSPTAKLDVEGGNILLGGNLAVRGNADIDYNVNIGKTITLAPSNSSLVLRPINVGESTYVPEPPEYVGYSPGTDTCDNDTNNFFWCNGITAGPACVDYGRVGGGGPYYKRTVTCAVQNGNYTIKNDYNSLKFINGVGETKITIGQDGNVGIGTTNPTPIVGSQRTLHISDTTNGAAVRLTGFSGIEGGIAIGSAGSVGMAVGTISSHALQLYTYSRERMRIDSAGNVGIGTTTPTTKLMVVSNDGDELRFSDGFFSGRDGLVITGNAGATGVNIQNKSATGIAGIQIIDHTGTGKAHMGWWNSDQRLEIVSDKNIVLLSNDPNFGVGIGTKNPGAKLEIYGGGDLLLKDDSTPGNDPGDLIFQGSTGTQAGRIWAGVGLGMALTGRSTNDIDLYLSPSGNVGIGTGGWAYAKLDISDNVGGTTPALRVNRNGWIAFFSQLCPGCYNGLVANNDKGLIFSDGSFNTGNLVIGPWGDANGIRIQGSNGNVGIGTASPTEKLTVNGNVKANDYYIGAIDKWASQLVINQQCKMKRGDAFTKDQVIWCDSTYPNMYSCNVLDDEAPPSPMTSTCTSDGQCDMSKLRKDLGTNMIYLERVVKSGNIYGCQAYDYEHNHTPYRLELMCCK